MLNDDAGRARTSSTWVTGNHTENTRPWALFLAAFGIADPLRLGRQKPASGAVPSRYVSPTREGISGMADAKVRMIDLPRHDKD